MTREQEHSEVDYSEGEFFPENFARQFKSWGDNVTSYSLSGGHIPSRYDFNRAKLKIKKAAN